ncbi:MAG: bacillithiol system redox-active protein YtxJ [Chitinophagaceae bacterium]
MNWTVLNSEEKLAEIITKSHSKPQVIFKHSIRCSISSMVKSRLEKSATPDTIDFHYLDLINYRLLSNKIAVDLDVFHESPQVLLLKDGECIYNESHMAIRMEDIAQLVA